MVAGMSWMSLKTRKDAFSPAATAASPARLPVRDWRPLYTELARLNRFSAVVIDGQTAPRDRAAMVELLRFYHPDLRVGIPSSGADKDKADFVLRTLDPGQDERVLEEQIRQTAGRQPRACPAPRGADVGS